MSEFLEKGVVLTFKQLVGYLEKGVPDPKLKLQVNTVTKSILVWDNGEITGVPTLVWENSRSTPKFNSSTVAFEWKVIETSHTKTPLESLREAIGGDLYDLFSNAHDTVWESFDNVINNANNAHKLPSEKTIMELQSGVSLLLELSKEITDAYYQE